MLQKGESLRQMLNVKSVRQGCSIDSFFAQVTAAADR